MAGEMLFKEGAQISSFLKKCRPPWLADEEYFWAYFALDCLILELFYGEQKVKIIINNTFTFKEQKLSTNLS